MAFLNTRGTLVRDRLDFFETSNCWGFVYGNTAGGPTYMYLINNATTALQLDVYAVQWFSSTPQPWELGCHAPVDTITPIIPTDVQVHSIQPDLPQPLGLVGMASAISPDIPLRILHQSGGATSGAVDIGYSSPHIVLPPKWVFSVSTIVSGACECSFTVFYQAVLDNVPPAQ